MLFRSPCGLRLTPVSLPRHDVSAVFELLEAEGSALDVAAPVVPIESARSSQRATSWSHGDAAVEPFVEPDWALMVRTFGALEVVAADGTPALFDRSKALELVVWLALHRRRPTRGAARAALWDLDVRDATFANVVSDARRALARTALPLPGEEWIPRTLTESLPLHELVVSDADLLDARVRHAAGQSHREAIEVLTPGLELEIGRAHV